jgi:hypothetical protein
MGISNDAERLLETMVRLWVRKSEFGRETGMSEDATVDGLLELIKRGFAHVVYDKQTKRGFRNLRVEIIFEAMAEMGFAERVQ